MKISEADILIIPGLHGSDSDHWQSRWEAKFSTGRRVEQKAGASLILRNGLKRL